VQQEQSKTQKLNLDAFADGQIGSKLWLCEELERVWTLGGWYGLASFLLFSRGQLRIKAARSFDRDAEACAVADQVNKNWEIQNWRFKAYTADCDLLDFRSTQYGPIPDIVINTSCEHFEKMDWWKNIPQGQLVALQSTDMDHPDHFAKVSSLGQMKERYRPLRIFYEGYKVFTYPNRTFTRYMLIGEKS
jgi:hypothetical protein